MELSRFFFGSMDLSLDSRLIQYLGRNTFTVMMHHMMVFFLIKTAFAAYKTDFYYCYLPKGIGQFKVFYLLLALILPLCLQKGIDYVKNRWEMQRKKAVGRTER